MMKMKNPTSSKSGKNDMMIVKRPDHTPPSSFSNDSSTAGLPAGAPARVRAMPSSRSSVGRSTVSGIIAVFSAGASPSGAV